jgi:hypothetical protein
MASGGTGSSAHRDRLRLSQALEIDDPQGRLLRFSSEEYPYYDGVADLAPDRIEPIDVLVTWSVNSNIYRVDPKKTFVDPAAKMRAIQRAMAARCPPILSQIPTDADLLTFDHDLQIIRKLLSRAIQVTGVGTAVATKVLHRKRRNFIPMLDNVVRDHYLTALEVRSLNTPENWANKELNLALALKALIGFREDLRESRSAVAGYREFLHAANYSLSPVRILEILIWTKLRRVYGP